MKPEVNPESLGTFKFADYKKALKKDKKLLKKARGAIFLLDYKFEDKKGLGIMLFRKAKEVKETFKQMKKEGQPVAKMAAGTCTLKNGDNGIEWHIELKMGNLSPEKITQKGKVLFNTSLSVAPVFLQATTTAEVVEDNNEELKTIFQQIKTRTPQLNQIVQGIKNNDTAFFTLENANFVQDLIDDIKEGLTDFKELEDEAVKKELTEAAKKYQSQIEQLNKIADVLGKRVVLTNFKEQYSELVNLYKAYKNS